MINLTYQPWWQILLIQISAITCLPAILIGKILCEDFGWETALTSIFIGNAILFIIGIVCLFMVIEKRQPTIEYAKDTFGKKGLPLFSFLLLFSSLCWFAIQLDLMSLTIKGFLESLGVELNNHFLWFSNATLGAFLTLGMIRGIRSLSFLSVIITPILLITLLYGISQMPKNTSFTALPLGSGLEGISLVIGFKIFGLIDLPTFLSHVKNRRDGLIAIGLLFGVAIPLMMCLGVYLFMTTGYSSVLDVFQTNAVGIWSLWLAVFLVLGGWTTNNYNMYSAAINSEYIFTNCRFKTRVFLIGLLGVFLACLNPIQHLESFLKLIGIAIGSMGAVIISSYLLGANRNSTRPIMAWFGGVVLGLATNYNFFIMTQLPVFDAFIGAYMINLLLTQRDIYENNYVIPKTEF